MDGKKIASFIGIVVGSIVSGVATSFMMGRQVDEAVNDKFDSLNNKTEE